MPTPEVKDVVESPSFWEIIKTFGIILGYILAGLFFIIKTPYLYMVGKFKQELDKLKSEHDEMYSQYKEENSKTASILRKKEEEEFNEIKQMLKDVQHDLKQVRQDYVNLKIFLKDQDRNE